MMMMKGMTPLINLSLRFPMKMKMIVNHEITIFILNY